MQLANKEEFLAYIKENEEKGRVKDSIMASVAAKTRGQYKKMSKKHLKCSNCGSKKNVVFHHFSYDKPKSYLDFTILCRRCHIRAHNPKIPLTKEEGRKYYLEYNRKYKRKLKEKQKSDF